MRFESFKLKGRKYRPIRHKDEHSGIWSLAHLKRSNELVRDGVFYTLDMGFVRYREIHDERNT